MINLNLQNENFIYVLKHNYFQINKASFNELNINNKNEMYDYVNELYYAFDALHNKIRNFLFISNMVLYFLKTFLNKYDCNIDKSIIDLLGGVSFGFFLILMIFVFLSIRSLRKFSVFYKSSLFDYRIKMNYIIRDESCYNLLDENTKLLYTQIDMSNLENTGKEALYSILLNHNVKIAN